MSEFTINRAMARVMAGLALALGASGAFASPEAPEIKQSGQVDTMTIGGDLRVREEYFDYLDAKSSTLFTAGARKTDRSRQRFRLRMRADYKLKDNLTASAALASGGGEAVSTNQSFAGMAGEKPLWIDQAFLSWTPGLLGDSGSLKIQGGKMANPIWRIYTSDLVFDPDISPEGFSEGGSYLVADSVNVFVNALQAALNESSASEHDPYLMTEQVGLELPLPAGLRLTAAGANHSWRYVGDQVLASPTTQLGNVRSVATAWNPAGLLRSDFDVDELTGQLTGWVAVPGLEMQLPVSLQGSFIKNMVAKGPDFSGSVTGTWVKPDGKTFIGKSDQGYQIGGMLGKVGGAGTWEIAYYYKRSAWDSTVADWADSDIGDLGGLNRKGNIFWVNYTPNGFVIIGVKVFNTRILDKRYVMTGTQINQPNQINRIQADVMVKF
jgi:hypothetical protein